MMIRTTTAQVIGTPMQKQIAILRQLSFMT
jgi:hypothetical protein